MRELATEEEVAPQLMKQIKRHAPEDPPPAMSGIRKRGLSRSHAASMGKGASVLWTGKTPNAANTRKRLAVSAGEKETRGRQTGQCDHQGDLWRPRGGEKRVRGTYGLCGTTQLDLTTDEWEVGPQDALLLKSASVAHSR